MVLSEETEVKYKQGRDKNMRNSEEVKVDFII